MQPLVLPRGSRRWRLATYQLTQIVDELAQRDIRYGAGRAMLPQRLAHALLVQMENAGESPDDRVQDAVARSRPVKACVDALWPAVDPVRLVMQLLSDADALAAAAHEILEPDEQHALLWRKAPRGPASAPWSPADAVLVDEARDLVERTGSLGHVVLDEAQDLSPMQLRAVGRRCSTGSTTVLGDLAQGTTPWATSSWDETLRHLGKPAATVTELTAGYRVPSQIIDYASRLLPTIAPGLAAASSVRDDPGALDVLRVDDLDPATIAACRDALLYEGSVGLVVSEARVGPCSAALAAAGLDHHVLGRDEHTELDRLVLVPAPLAKGLEYDRVVVVEPAEIVEAETRGLRRLYVALTRAVSGLVVLHTRPLPHPLAASEHP
jgi:hypothetical protein